MLNGVQTSRKSKIFTPDRFRFSQGYPVSIAIHAIIHKKNAMASTLRNVSNL
jgi:hypothetical protein